VAVVGTIVLFSGASVAGGAVSPEDTETYQSWDFLTADKGPMLPEEGYDNDYSIPGFLDDPMLKVVTAGNWYENIGTAHPGSWELIDGEIDIIIPNYPDITRPYKEIWVDIMWRPFGQDWFLPDNPGMLVKGYYGEASVESFSYITELETIDQGDGWFMTTYYAELWPNPLWEWVAIKGDIEVDWVQVKTYCVPEPVSAAIFSLGAVIALGRRRRRLNCVNQN